MIEHLSPQDFAQLARKEIKGKALLTALDHLEVCEECRLKVISPTKAELLEMLFSDKDVGKPNEHQTDGEIDSFKSKQCEQKRCYPEK